LQDAILEEARAGKIMVPLAILARESMLKTVPSVTTATKVSMIEIGTHLLERGYRRPGFMTGPAAQASLVSRYQHFADFWRQHGVSDVPALAAGSYDRHDSENAMRRYLAATHKSDRIDVLVCENDNLALGAIDVATREFGLKVPQELAFVGYDNIDMASSPTYSLTTYEQPLEQMIDAVLSILGGPAGQGSREIKGRLVVRSST
jgi:LacI family transcriptional regulator